MKVKSRVQVTVDDQVFNGHVGTVVETKGRGSQKELLVEFDNYRPACPHIDPKAHFAFFVEELKEI